MKIVTRVGTGKVQHAADYDPADGSVSLYCKALTYAHYLGAIVDPTPPTENAVTCKQCLKRKDEWKAPE